MTRELLNTLFVMTPDAYARLDHDSLKVEADGAKLAQVPLHHLGSIMLFGNAMISAQTMHRCAAEGRAINLMDYGGRFKARVVGPMCGNVLLRQAQYEAHRDEACTVEIARAIIAGKVKNTCQSVMRAAKETKTAEDALALRECGKSLGSLLDQFSVFECTVNEAQMETLRLRLKKAIQEEEDSLRIYLLRGRREGAVEAYGKDCYVDFRQPLVV